MRMKKKCQILKTELLKKALAKEYYVLFLINLFLKRLLEKSQLKISKTQKCIIKNASRYRRYR
jgi:hypothetical protein